MAIYEALSRVYDVFFPPNPRATAFLDALVEAPGREAGRGRSILDLGCATGSQVLDLAAAGWRGVGYEPCLPMLDLARGKAQARGLGGAVAFKALGMMDAGGTEPGKDFDLVLCLGNTLPYLDGPGELARFLADSLSLLAPGGALVLQLLNYSKVIESMDRGGFSFPDLEAAGMVFSRHYEGRSDGKLDFVTRLAGSGGSPVQGKGSAGAETTAAEGRDALSPFRPSELASALGASGFKDLEAHPGWEARAFDEEADGYLVIVARPEKRG